MKMTKLDLKLDFRQHINENDMCYYIYDYLSNGGYKNSNANNLIQNFKKPIDRRNLPEWRYRNKAIAELAQTIDESLKGHACTIIPCPMSNPRAHANFNDRLDELCRQIGERNENYDIQYCLDTSEPYPSAHSSGGTRNPDEIYDLTTWCNPTKTPYHYIVLIDDVLTTGAHFRAYKDKIQKNNPNNIIIGLFLARCVWE